MTDPEMRASDRQPEAAPCAPDRAAQLERFRGPVEARDAEVVAHWRVAAPAVHASAMIDLANVAEQIVKHTGFGKDPDEMVPGFPPVRRRHAADESTGS